MTSLASENSEVSPVALLVAVPVTNTPGDSSRGSLKVNGAVPLLLVVTVVWPITASPSPKLDASFSSLEMN